MSQFISRFALAAGLLLPAVPALADEAPAKAARKTAWEASLEHDDNAMISTGVAKARDPLNSATSTSVLKEPEIRRLGPTSIAEVLRTVPGIRVESDLNEVGNSYAIRGLPLVGDGAKYLQLQEDGLPTLQFGDISGLLADGFLRNDLNLASIESIRGGSASTFASDAPGGVINFVSKTGDVEGGSIMASAGLERGVKRIDADYGGRLSNEWRFHIGGFYRVGEGSRSIGYDAYRGGQVKFNVTREFAGGYVRFSVKVLDDRSLAPSGTLPMAVSGTESNPVYGDLPNFSAKNDSLVSRYMTQAQFLAADGGLRTMNMHDGQRMKSLALGLETQFALGGWTIAERFRYSRNSAVTNSSVGTAVLPVPVMATVFGGPGAIATYFNGPNAGQPVGALANGNGALVLDATVNFNFRDLDLIANDLRANRVFAAAGGDLTLTGGLYAVHQTIASERAVTMMIQDVAGNAGSSYVNLSNGGFPISQNGTFMFSALGPAGVLNSQDVGHTIIAPYGSFNFHKGAISIGGSLRYDTDTVRGTAQWDRAQDRKFVDIDGNGVPSSFAETTFAFIAPGIPDQVHYTTRRLSWSTGINWRIAEELSAFARISSGARKQADRILTASSLNPVTGSLFDPSTGIDKVRQTEVGLKFRRPGVMFNVTGFYATSSEASNQLSSNGNTSSYQLVRQSYRAYGAELEGAVRSGPFSVNAGATLTRAEITAAAGHPELVGNLARHQPTLIWQVTPEYSTDLFSLGASVVGSTSSYTQDINRLRMPGYATVAVFARVRPVERLELGVNVSNLFDKLAIINVLDSTMPATGVVLGSTLPGRRATASVRFFF